MILVCTPFKLSEKSWTLVNTNGSISAMQLLTMFEGASFIGTQCSHPLRVLPLSSSTFLQYSHTCIPVASSHYFIYFIPISTYFALAVPIQSVIL